MLLAIDVGNTNITTGVYDRDGLKHHFRMETRRDSTADELAVTLINFLNFHNVDFKKIKGVSISNVVPSLEHSLVSMTQRYFKLTPLCVNHENAGIPMNYPNPPEIGADRLVNAAAAFDKYRVSCLIVDFGTATTFDYVDSGGAYCGGAIAPGIQIANEALYRWAAKLPHVNISKTDRVVAKSTIEAVKAGVYHGYVGLVDYLVEKMIRETCSKPKVIATGGIASLVASESKTIEVIERFLTLDGLRLIWERNNTK